MDELQKITDYIDKQKELDLLDCNKKDYKQIDSYAQRYFNLVDWISELSKPVETIEQELQTLKDAVRDILPDEKRIKNYEDTESEKEWLYPIQMSRLVELKELLDNLKNNE